MITQQTKAGGWFYPGFNGQGGTGVGGEARERRLLRCWGCPGDGMGQGGCRLAVVSGLQPAAARGPAWKRWGASVAELGRTGGHEGGHQPCQPRTEWVDTPPPPRAWGKERATPWGQGGAFQAGVRGTPARGAACRGLGQGGGSVVWGSSGHPQSWPEPQRRQDSPRQHLPCICLQEGEKQRSAPPGAGGQLTPPRDPAWGSAQRQPPASPLGNLAPAPQHPLPLQPLPPAALTSLGQDEDLFVRQALLPGELGEPLQALGTELLCPACGQEQGERQPPGSPP